MFSKIRDVWRRFGRAIVAVITAGGVLLASALTDGHVDQGEGIQIAIAFTAAVGVWLAPNLPYSGGVKTSVAVLLAVLELAATLITDGLTSAEIINLILAGLGVIGVGVAPSVSRGELAPPPSVQPFLRAPRETLPPRR
jgi:hypothetical protein